VDEVPEQVRKFIWEHIDSVELLCVLILLKNDSQRSWTVPDLTRELRSTERSVEKRLEALYSRKVLQPPPGNSNGHRYVPTSPELEATILLLAQVNAQRQYRVMELIFSKPAEALRAFADAFKLKRDE
jgi:hypothetical protein